MYKGDNERDGPETGLPRRRMVAATLAICAFGASPIGAAALTVKPRMRVIIDNDFSGDPDGLFQLAQHLTSPSVQIPLIIGSHIHVNDFVDRSVTQGENAARLAHEVCARMKLDVTPPIVAGRNAAPPVGAAPVMTTATQKIIAEAMRDDTKLPLFYTAGAGLTELAEAVKLEPRIGKRLRLIWIGGMEHPDLNAGIPPRSDPEYNLRINTAAVQTIFNDSDIEIWQVPRNVYRQMNVSHAELDVRLRQSGKLGAFLLAQLERVITLMPLSLGETYILGDSPLVTLTALQSSFDADSSSSAYIVKPTPRISDKGQYVETTRGRPMRVYTSIDTRLTFEDMFLKIKQYSL